MPPSRVLNIAMGPGQEIPEKQTATFLAVRISFLICLLAAALSVSAPGQAEGSTALEEARGCWQCEMWAAGDAECLAGTAGHC